MPWPSTLHVSLETAKPAFVLDLGLLLKPEGLLLALLLARGGTVWLSRLLWTFLDDHQAGEGSGLALVDTAIEIWNEARIGLNLGGVENIYWAYDCDDESILPKGLEGGFVDRLDALVAGLELRRDRAAKAKVPAFGLGNAQHETLALGAALWCCRATILAVDPGDKPPPLIEALEAAGIGCKALDQDRPEALLRQAFDPLLVETGVLDLMIAADLKLIALHLAMPKAPLVSGRLLAEHAELWSDIAPAPETAEAATLTDPWNLTSAYWYRLP